MSTKTSVFTLNNNRYKTKVINLFEYLLAVLLILTCNTVFFRTPNTHLFRVIQISCLVFLFVTMLLVNLLMLKNKKLLQRYPLIIIIYSGLFLVFMFFNNIQSPLNKVYAITTFLFVPLCALLYFGANFYNGRQKILLFKIETIISVLAVYSLVMWLIGPELHILRRTGYYPISWGGIRGIPSYSDIFFAAQGSIKFLGISLTRNTGIFCEAPMFAFVLDIGFLIQLFIRKNMNIRIIVLGATLISTTSTTGVIVAIIAIGLKFLTGEWLKNHFSKIYKYLIPFLIVMIIGISAYLIQKKMSMNSYSLRMDDFVAGFQAWIKHPIIGNGVNNYAAITKYMQSSRLHIATDSGFSSGLMRVVAGGGISLFLFYVMPTIIYTVKHRWFHKNLLFFSVMLLGVLSFLIIDNTYLFIVLIAWLWANIVFSIYTEKTGRGKI